MNAVELAIRQLKVDEGVAQYMYLCPSGYPTIGVGRRVDRGGRGLHMDEIDLMLENDVNDAIAFLQQTFEQWDSFADRRKAALINVVHQVGFRGLLGFKKMVAAIHAGDWATAADELLDIDMGRKFPDRTMRRSAELRLGV